MHPVMSRIKLQSVGQLAARSGVSVRTLHYYDEIGLLRPPLRSQAGRRLYDRDSVVRLQQILTYRTLGLTLEDIRRVLDDPKFDRREALQAQRAAVERKIAQSEALLRGIDDAIALIKNSSRKEFDMTRLFDGFDPKQFENEAKARWGKTEAWAISRKRTAKYTEDDWSAYREENDAVCKSLANLMAQGLDAEAPEVQRQVRAYSDIVDRWFYPCGAEQIGGLAAMYEADKRFRDSFDAYGDGLSMFVIRAFKAFAGEV